MGKLTENDNFCSLSTKNKKYFHVSKFFTMIPKIKAKLCLFSYLSDEFLLLIHFTTNELELISIHIINFDFLCIIRNYTDCTFDLQFKQTLW